MKQADQPVPLYYAMPLRTAIGGFFGYAVGEFIKKFTKKIARYAGGTIIMLSLLAYNDWISINWKKIDKDLLNLLFRGTRQAQGLVSYFQRVFTHGVPLMGGFYLGLQYSVKQALPGF